MEDYLIYHLVIAEDIARDIANSAFPNDAHTQRAIMRKYGVDIDDLSESDIDYLSKRVNEYLR